MTEHEALNITKIVNGGYGLTHLATGQIALIRQVLPNEMVIITIEQTKKNYLFGKVEQIVKPHPARIPPPCKYYGQCGGCNLQHCDYYAQLTIKKNIIEDLLRRQGPKTVRDSISLLADPIPSPSRFAYRQRIRLQVGDRSTVGFRRFHSHDIIPIDMCLLAGDDINRTLTALREHETGRRLCGHATEVELHSNPQTGKSVCIFHFSRKIRPADAASAREFCRKVHEVERIFFIGPDFPITGPYFQDGRTDKTASGNSFNIHYPSINKVERAVDLSWEAGGFCQVNLAQNKTLIEIAVEFCQTDNTETVLDLYCGMGNFAIPLAFMAKTVLGVEGQGSAIRSARYNAAAAGCSNTRFIKSPVHNACRELAEQGQTFDCVLIDPPRQGAGGLAGQLAAIAAKRLVYISCDPATLCRDLAALCERGFTISKIQPVDMFPQTHHIETVVLLEK
jgi:23S rRNA (uracil1939-C5)-methyltransferase